MLNVNVIIICVNNSGCDEILSNLKGTKVKRGQKVTYDQEATKANINYYKINTL